MKSTPFHTSNQFYFIIFVVVSTYFVIGHACLLLTAFDGSTHIPTVNSSSKLVRYVRNGELSSDGNLDNIEKYSVFNSFAENMRFSASFVFELVLFIVSFAVLKSFVYNFSSKLKNTVSIITTNLPLSLAMLQTIQF